MKSYRNTWLLQKPISKHHLGNEIFKEKGALK